MRVDEAFDRIAEHFASPPFAQKDDTEIALQEAGSLRLIKRDGNSLAPLEGHLQLGPAGLRLSEGEEILWERTLAQLRAVSVEVRNQLTLRTGEELYEIRLANGSPLKWGHFLREWITTETGA